MFATNTMTDATAQNLNALITAGFTRVTCGKCGRCLHQRRCLGGAHKATTLTCDGCAG
jgi:hypothetical protein